MKKLLKEIEKKRAEFDIEINSMVTKRLKQISVERGFKTYSMLCNNKFKFLRGDMEFIVTVLNENSILIQKGELGRSEHYSMVYFLELLRIFQ